MAALVTGASAGLGAEFARSLAARGQDLILTARRLDRLETLAGELRKRHGVSVAVFRADLGDPGAPAELLAAIEAAGLEIDTLVNNAGFGARGAVADMAPETLLGQIDVNCRALVALTHGVLPAMIARGQGAILNLASTAAFVPGPWMATYYASKAFVLSFSQALHEEVRDKGVKVSALCPGPTHTEFAAVAGMSDSALFQRLSSDAETVVRDGLAALDANQAVKVSGVANALMAQSTRLMPRGLLRRFAGRLQQSRSR